MTLVAVGTGLLIGGSLGALGGGSILTVPALVYLLGQSPHRLSAAFTMLVILVAGYTVVRSLPGLV